MEPGAPGEGALFDSWRRFWEGRLPRRGCVTEITPGVEAKKARDTLNLRNRGGKANLPLFPCPSGLEPTQGACFCYHLSGLASFSRCGGPVPPAR